MVSIYTCLPGSCGRFASRTFPFKHTDTFDRFWATPQHTEVERLGVGELASAARAARPSDIQHVASLSPREAPGGR